MRTLTLIGIAAILLASPIIAQEDAETADSPEPTTESSSDGFSVGFDIGIGVQTFENPDYDPVTNPDVPEMIAWQSLKLAPELAIGKIGIGLDLTVNYRFTGGATGNEFEVRPEDWVPDPDAGRGFFALYLPKIQYVRYAQKGDPLYLKLGSIEDGTLGNGFIMAGYANTLYLPETRLFGMSFDIDGRLFGFPYVGIETFVSNLAAFDILGSRLYARPLVDLEIPVVSNLQVGTTVVADRDPYYFASRDPDSIYFNDAPVVDPVVIWGADLRLPVLASEVLSLATFGDFVVQNGNTGGMLGFGGRLIGFVTYGAQLRFLGDNFIPVYFDASYDLFRVGPPTAPGKYAVYSGDVTVPGYVGWYASLGFSLLDDLFYFNAALDGPFGGADSEETFKKPRFRGTFVLAEGILPGVSIEASYDKKDIATLSDLFDPENAVIGARLNYRTGPAILSLVYDLRYDPFVDPGEDPWVVTSGLESTISLF